MKGRSGDAWHKKVASLPLRKKLEILSLTGFKGIYIDRRAYKQKELESLENGLINILKTVPLESCDKNLAFFSMNDYNRVFLKKFTKAQRVTMRKELLHKGVN